MGLGYQPKRQEGTPVPPPPRNGRRREDFSSDREYYANTTFWQRTVEHYKEDKLDLAALMISLLALIAAFAKG